MRDSQMEIILGIGATVCLILLLIMAIIWSFEIYESISNRIKECMSKQPEDRLINLSKDVNKHDNEIIRFGDDRKIIPNIDKDGKISLNVEKAEPIVDSHLDAITKEAFKKAFEGKGKIELKDHAPAWSIGIPEAKEFKDFLVKSLKNCRRLTRWFYI